MALTAFNVQAVRKSKEAFKLSEDAQYGSSPFKPKDKVRNQHVMLTLTLHFCDLLGCLTC